MRRSALLNDVAFNYPGAPITNLRATIEKGSVVQRGGHTGNLENLGLRTWMVDYGKLAPAARARTVAAGMGP